MRNVTLSFLFILGLLTVNDHCLAQNSEKEICARLQSQFDKLQQLDQDKPEDLKKLLAGNRKLNSYLAHILTHVPATLHMGFAPLKDHLTIYSAKDGRMRIYSWDAHINHYKFELLQAQLGDSTVLLKRADQPDDKIDTNLLITDNGTNDYLAIVPIRLDDQHWVHLVICNNRIGQSTLTESITAYTIEGSMMKAQPFFRTAKGLRSTISLEYDPTFEQNYEVNANIHLSVDNKRLYIPIVRDNKLTKKYLVYVFDGNNFIFDKNAR